MITLTGYTFETLLLNQYPKVVLRCPLWIPTFVAFCIHAYPSISCEQDWKLLYQKGRGVQWCLQWWLKCHGCTETPFEKLTHCIQLPSRWEGNILTINRSGEGFRGLLSADKSMCRFRKAEKHLQNSWYLVHFGLNFQIMEPLLDLPLMVSLWLNF